MKKKSKKISSEGMRPNVMQRRPVSEKPSPAKPFNITRQKGK